MVLQPHLPGYATPERVHLPADETRDARPRRARRLQVAALRKKMVDVEVARRRRTAAVVREHDHRPLVAETGEPTAHHAIDLRVPAANDGLVVRRCRRI